MSSTLTIDSDDPDSPLVDLSMAGTAIDPGGSGGGCSIGGGKLTIEDALAGYGLLIATGLWLVVRRRKGENEISR